MVQIKDGLLVPPSEPAKIDIPKQNLIFENGAKCFYVIAALSLVNTAISLSQVNFRFLVGLGITQFVDVLAVIASQEIPAVSLIIKIIAVILNTIFAGVIALFGWLALQKKSWAFVVGMILYSFDGVLSFLFQDWIGLGFHVLALIVVLKGLIALRTVKGAEAKRIQASI